MRRLTEKHSDGTYGLKIRKNISDMEMKWNAYDKLGKYEDAEEDGLLLRLPCKVGSTVYLINSKYTKCTRENQEFDEYSCQGCEWLDCDSRKEYYIHVNKSVSLEWIIRYSKDFGKTVFLTKEEAEQALAEKQNS